MAKIHGIPGEWARVKGTVVGLWPLFLGFFVQGFAVALMAFDSTRAWGAALLVLSLGWCIWSVYRGMRHVERYFKGARGEERVSAILGNLPDAYHVFNDFVACGRHVDHVVVGPAGVFAVETKYWRGKVTIEDGHILLDGQLPNRSPLAQVLGEAHAVREQLAKSGWAGTVTPVLTFASDAFEAKIAELQGAVVINSKFLKDGFSTERVVLPPSELERLVGIMESDS